MTAPLLKQIRLKKCCPVYGGIMENIQSFSLLMRKSSKIFWIYKCIIKIFETRQAFL